MIEEDAPGRQQRHSARGAPEERRSDLLLERADLPAQRRLRHVEVLRGSTDVAFLGDGNEVADLREAHVPRMPFLPAAAQCRQRPRARSKWYWTVAAQPPDMG
jgi:hypothetical protein